MRVPLSKPGAIYTVGLNYDGPGAAPRPERPLIYGKASSSIAGDGDVLSWDRELTPNVDAEVELGVVVGDDGGILGYTIVNDVSSRDPWLDGDQWLLGKSMPGFCPVGPWVVTPDDFDPTDVRLGCTINGEAIQDGRTNDMRFSVAEIVAYLGRHIRLERGDLIATGTPARLAGPLGPGRHLQPGDVVTAWIEGIGELTTTVA
jgi:2,4-didehydro-3-deoxy-L-rhamnonate hydrolase